MYDDKKLQKALKDWVHQLMRLSMHGFIRYSRESGLSMSQIGALFRIHRSKMCGVANIGEDLGITSAAASQMLDRLVQQDLVERVEDPDDRRGKRISLTEKGRKIVQESMYARQGWIPQLSESLTDEEKTVVMEAVSLLSRKAETLGGGISRHCHPMMPSTDEENTSL